MELVSASIGVVLLLFIGITTGLNVPTWILLIIYFVFRAKKRKQKMLDKMNIHDLNTKSRY